MVLPTEAEGQLERPESVESWDVLRVIVRRGASPKREPSVNVVGIPSASTVPLVSGQTVTLVEVSLSLFSKLKTSALIHGLSDSHTGMS